MRPFHVKEAYRLLTCSILKLEKSDIVLNEEEEYVQDRIGDLEIDSNKLLV